MPTPKRRTRPRGRPPSGRPRGAAVSGWVSADEKARVIVYCDHHGIGESLLVRQLLVREGIIPAAPGDES